MDMRQENLLLQNHPLNLKLLQVVLLRQMAKCKVKSAWVAPLLSEDGGRWVGGGPGRTTAGQSLPPNLHDDDAEEKKKMRRRRIMMNSGWVGGGPGRTTVVQSSRPNLHFGRF